MKKNIMKFYYFVEFIKVIIFKNFFGLNSVINALMYCWKNNIVKILEYYGATVGINNHFKGSLIIDNPNLLHSSNAFVNLYIGDNCYIGKNVFFDLANEIIISNEVVISAGVTIMTHADVGDRALKKYYKRLCEPVEIGKGTWIGANVTILSGVTIGEYCVIAAGSVVKENIKSFSMAAGVPAKFKKDIRCS